MPRSSGAPSRWRSEAVVLAGSTSRRAKGAAGAVVAALLAVLWFTAGPGASPDAATTGSSRAGATDPASGLPFVDAEELPAQARTTLGLIAAGGPFPYARDGVTFGNRERLLPQEPAGYYREFTVRTPGEDDRGARRIVAGEQGERYWTSDHYASFQRVRGGPT